MARPILLVDDDELVLQTMGMLLESKGYEVETARNGLEALHKVEEREFALVISDIRMPGMDGIEVVKRLREINEERRRKAVPEILITAYADENVYLQALKLNVTAYLHKPFDLNELLEVVAKKVA